MKILSISNCPLIESQGSGYVILNFTRGLRSRGHEVDLFDPESYELFQFFNRRATSYRQALGMLFFTLRKIFNKKYDVVEFYGGSSWLAILVLKQMRSRDFLIVSHSNGLETYFHEVLIECYKKGYIENPFPKFYHFHNSNIITHSFTKADALVTVSKNDYNYAIKHEYKDEKHILAIENSLPASHLNLKVNFNRENIVGYCGSWLSNKGKELVQNDISKILIDFPDCQFKLIGVGDNFNKEEHFPLSVCSRITVIPFLDKQGLKEVYQSISILVFPSCYESFGLVLAEAMACGCAVVATKVGFAASLKHMEEVFIIEQPASPLLYEGVKKLLFNEPLRLKIAQNAYQRVQKLRWELAIDSLENAYTDWLQEIRENFNI
jgi:glycosyltransferase involved in cell wall biosynthesis